MLKGVNRQVVEIAQPESIYFEKVLLFVKPEYSSVSEKKLRSKADMLIRNATTPPHEKAINKKYSKVIQIAKLVVAAGSGAAAVGILSFFF